MAKKEFDFDFFKKETPKPLEKKEEEKNSILVSMIDTFSSVFVHFWLLIVVMLWAIKVSFPESQSIWPGKTMADLISLKDTEEIKSLSSVWFNFFIIGSVLVNALGFAFKPNKYYFIGKILGFLLGAASVKYLWSLNIFNF